MASGGTNEPNQLLFSNYSGWPPVHNRDIAYGDSQHWQDLAQGALNRVRENLADDYPQWADGVWPGDTIDSLTWRQIYNQAEKAYSASVAGETDITKLVEIARS